MSVQLGLFGDEDHGLRLPVWSQLPATVQREIAELFAETLIANLRPSAPCAEERDDEPIEDSGEPSRT